MITKTELVDCGVSLVEHVVGRVERSVAEDAPFSHVYVERLFPEELYQQMLESLPPPREYAPLSATNHIRADGVCARGTYALDAAGLERLDPAARALWKAVVEALTSAELQRVVFRKLATDLSYRYGIDREQVDRIAAQARPVLYRDLDGYEIPPHPDTRKKVVTMQIYLPRDQSQLDLGTALYVRRFPTLRGLVSWKGRFRKVKQFPFAPNSGYAFVVNNRFGGKKSWHGREELPAGTGERHSLLNTFYGLERACAFGC